jgi:hypothetical protein
MQARHDPDTPTANAAATSSANVDEDIIALLYKIAFIGRCLPLGGQVSVGCMVPPAVPRQCELRTLVFWRDGSTQTALDRVPQCTGVACVDSPGLLYLFCTHACNRGSGQGRQATWLHSTRLRPRTTGQHHPPNSIAF